MIDLSASTMSPAELDHFMTWGQYQPYRLPNGIITGAGLALNKRTSLRRIHVDSDDPDRDDFIKAAYAQSAMYEDFIRLLTAHTDVQNLTYLDTCCNSGYFCYRLSQLRVATSVGIDIGDYGPIFDIVNREMGTAAEFIRGAYDMARHDFVDLGDRKFDIVSNVAYFCHNSDPTFLLAALAKRAKKALLLFSLFPASEEFFISFGSKPNHYYNRPFPLCFDNGVRMSESLLRFGLEDLGFSTIHEAPHNPNWPFRSGEWRCFLALR